MPHVQVALPDQAPVMVLPSTVLFPHALMPLYIFEPRYRAMLAAALERDRVFCMAQRKPASSETHSPADFFHTAGVGLVRACVAREDGTSHLMLQGLARVRFTGFSQTQPFFMAKLEAVESPVLPDDEVAAMQVRKLADKVRGLCRHFRDINPEAPEEIDEFLEKVDDPGMLADSVAHAFLRDPLLRQHLLEEANVLQRLSALARYLREELNLPK
jgi:Lon protease-like protein